MNINAAIQSASNSGRTAGPEPYTGCLLIVKIYLIVKTPKLEEEELLHGDHMTGSKSPNSPTFKINEMFSTVQRQDEFPNHPPRAVPVSVT